MTRADAMNLMDALRDAGVEEAIASSELAGDHPDSAQPSRNPGQLREDHGARLRRLVGELAAQLDIQWSLSPADAIYVCEGAAARIRREAEEAKRAKDGGAMSAATVEVICSECNEGFLAPLKRRSGRPRKTCDARCAMARNRRLAAEVVEADRAEAARWWLGLSWDQRDAAMAWVSNNPSPPNFRGGKQLWAYFNRAAFSCEQRVVSGVR